MTPPNEGWSVHRTPSYNQLKSGVEDTHRDAPAMPGCSEKHLQVDAQELAPAASKLAGHIPVATVLPGAGCQAWLRTQPAGTLTHQESLLLSACLSSRWRRTTLLLPRAAWGMSASSQPGASWVPESLLKSLPATLVPDPPGVGEGNGEWEGCSCGCSRGNSWCL